MPKSNNGTKVRWTVGGAIESLEDASEPEIVSVTDNSTDVDLETDLANDLNKLNSDLRDVSLENDSEKDIEQEVQDVVEEGATPPDEETEAEVSENIRDMNDSLHETAQEENSEALDAYNHMRNVPSETGYDQGGGHPIDGNPDSGHPLEAPRGPMDSPEGPRGDGEIPSGPGGLDESEDRPRVPDGPRSDPYDDKLGQPGVNASPEAEPVGNTQAPKENGVPNQQPNQEQNPDPSKRGQSPDKNGELDQGGKNGEAGAGGGRQQRPGGSYSGDPGNGYGALNRPTKETDVTQNARRNFVHQTKANGESGRNTGGSRGTALNSPGKSRFRQTLSSIKDRLNPFSKTKGQTNKPGGNTFNASGKGETESSTRSNGVANFAKKAVSFIAKHPYLAAILIIILIIIFFLLGNEVSKNVNSGGRSRRSSSHCTYDLKGITSSGRVNLNSVTVELMKCDTTEGSVDVLETVDLEKYVLGVALAEAGPDAPDEALKAQIIAARNFVLTRNRQMCEEDPDNCWIGYNKSSESIKIRACENDQVYWDYEKDIYRVNRGDVSLYSPEVDSTSTGAILWQGALSESQKEHVLEVAATVKGKVLVDQNENVMSLGYKSSETDTFVSEANAGKTYSDILYTVYGSRDFNSAFCTTMGNIDYGDYTLSSDGDEILHTRLDTFLSQNGSSLDDFNDLISKNVEKAGYGTRAGVVAAAVTLIAELGNNYHVKVPYYWGGGHGDGIAELAAAKWGSNACHTYANDQSYDYCGLDCSGFVPWAIKNGGFNMVQNTASNFQYLSGAERVRLNGSTAVLQPGDLLESSEHIVLVVGIDEDAHQYICAEAMGNSYGVKFNRRSFAESGYWGVRMDGYYEKNSKAA